MKLIVFSTNLACFLALLETNSCISEQELNESELPEDLDHECSVLLNAFAKRASDFTHCAVKSARPFKFCCVCSMSYSRLIKYKKDIYGKCYKQLVSSEKYQIVERMFQFANSLWYTSHCDACFKHISNEGEKWEITHGVKVFFDEMRELKICFKNNSQVSNSTIRINSTTSNMTVCKNCMPHYNRLNQIYKHAISNDNNDLEHKDNAICGDVAAAMNYTRHTWSKVYNCNIRQFDLMSVVALTCFFGFIPIVFYVAVTINGQVKSKRMETGLPNINYDTE